MAEMLRSACYAGGVHISKERRKSIAARSQRADLPPGIEAGENMGQVALSAAGEEQSRHHHHKHQRLEEPGEEAQDEDEANGPPVEPPPPQHSLEDTTKEDVDPASLCVRMPCCRDYGPNCAHIPHCDAALCATRPCC